MLDHSTNSLFITKISLKSPCSSISMHIDLMNSLHRLSVLTVHRFLLKYQFYQKLNSIFEFSVEFYIDLMCHTNFLSKNIFGGVTKIWEGVVSKYISKFFIYFTEPKYICGWLKILCGISSRLTLNRPC